ncbi:MAG: hypothetical protein SynsKO_41950 [Synoicihabitans sp.]
MLRIISWKDARFLPLQEKSSVGPATVNKAANDEHDLKARRLVARLAFSLEMGRWQIRAAFRSFPGSRVKT